MSEQASKRASISVAPTTLTEFNNIRGEWNQSQDDMVKVLARAWRAMSHEDQSKAITGHRDAVAPEPFVDGNPDYIQGDSLQATAACLSLARVIERAMRDHKMDAAELGEVIAEAIKTDKQLRRVVADCQEAHRRSSGKARSTAA